MKVTQRRKGWLGVVRSKGNEWLFWGLEWISLNSDNEMNFTHLSGLPRVSRDNYLERKK